MAVRPCMFPTSALPLDLEERVHTELIGTEEVVWAGQPVPEEMGRRRMGLPMIGLGLIAFGTFWIRETGPLTLSADRPGWALPLAGVPLLLLGLAAVYAPWWAARLARQTCYVLTNGRAIVLKAHPFGMRSTREFFGSHLRDMHAVEHENGIGDLVFKEIETINADGRAEIRQYGFMGVENVRELELLVRQTLGESGEGERVSR